MDVVMKELFGSDIGLLSLFTIGFLIAMGLFLMVQADKEIARGRQLSLLPAEHAGPTLCRPVLFCLWHTAASCRSVSHQPNPLR